ncbi:MAG: hypothetical protein J3K34DRAFT_478706 [Monoraphidium minutum]|nr:MAG: hypothetical protein J3K34DRAFT_478706 [Monoraphidium minutum]
MSVFVDAHVAGFGEDAPLPLGVIDCNVPTSPRSAKKPCMIAECCPSPATPSQPRLPAPGAAAGADAAADADAALDAAAASDPLAEPLAAARELLRDPSATDGAPLGREAQHARLAAAAAAFAAGGRGEALYVSGLPGTGKSHTVRRALQALAGAGGGGEVATLWVNCMAVSGAGEAYARIAAAASGGGGGGGGAAPGKRRAPGGEGGGGGGTMVSYEHLLTALRGGAAPAAPTPAKRRRGSGASGAAGCGGGRRGGCGPQVVVVLDELDALLSKGQQGVYDLFMLPHQPGVRALVIGIANSIDLTERALPALKLRGCTPGLLAFPAYSTAQVVGILGACLEQLPERLFDAAAVELCARQVSSTSGDLRMAVKACRAALDALTTARAAQLAAGSGGKAPPARVGVRDMMAALGRLAGVRSSQHGAATVASVRSLPNQQQLLLYSLTVLCPPPDAADTLSSSASLSSDSFGSSSSSFSGVSAAAAAAAGSPAAGGGGGGTPAGRGRSAASLWAELGPPGGGAPGSAAKAVRAPGAAGGAGRRLFGAGGGGGGAGKGGGGGYVLAVALEDAYCQYCKVCRLVGMAPAGAPELRHMADLLAQMALIDVVEAAAPGGGGGGGTPGGGAALTPGGAGGRRKGPRGFGGAAAAAPRGGGGGGGARLSLRAGHDEIHRALAANPALRCLVDGA